MITDPHSPARIHQAVGTLQVAMGMEVGFVQIFHAFYHVSHKRKLEIFLQPNIVIHDDILKIRHAKGLSQELFERFIF